jgi:hypothetical protein
MYAIEATGLLSALKRENQNYMLFLESDINSRTDSSLIYNTNIGTFTVWLTSTKRAIVLNANDLRTLLLNHTAINNPKGIARKEFIQNLAGNFIIVNNQTGVVSGTAPTTIGYNGVNTTSVIPTLISDNADNGNTFDISHWFNFSVQDLYQTISLIYPQFHALLQKAGLSKDKEGRYIFYFG